jgi:uncharacterized protein (TIGR02646 family)
LAGAVDSDTVGQKYSVVKHDLWVQQKMKCCYCDAWNECDYRDVEHFRPKVRANRMNGAIDPGYWWLAWTWENLLFSCPNCNRSAKNDAFPLEIGSMPLAAEAQPPGQERATLIDPYSEDPVDFIEFVFDGMHWRPRGRNGSTRGQRTVEILELDRAALLTRYNDYVNESVRPRIDELTEAIAQRDESRIRTAWRRVRALLVPGKDFVALSFDAIAYFVPTAVRAPWGLELPKPPVRHP